VVLREVMLAVLPLTVEVRLVILVDKALSAFALVVASVLIAEALVLMFEVLVFTVEVKLVMLSLLI
jgi:hypothetical protein